jgi:hypothetical protein
MNVELNRTSDTVNALGKVRLIVNITFDLSSCVSTTKKAKIEEEPNERMINLGPLLDVRIACRL